MKWYKTKVWRPLSKQLEMSQNWWGMCAFYRGMCARQTERECRVFVFRGSRAVCWRPVCRVHLWFTQRRLLNIAHPPLKGHKITVVLFVILEREVWTDAGWHAFYYYLEVCNWKPSPHDNNVNSSATISNSDSFCMLTCFVIF